MEEFKRQAVRFGTETLFGEVTTVNLKQRPFQVVVGKENLTCDSLIVATGATAKLLGLESESKLMGHGVSACATCDGFFFKDKELVVVGGGDTAMEEAIFLTKFANKVNVVHRRDTLRASKIMQDRAVKNPKISFIWDSVVDDIYGDPKAGGVTGVRLKNLKTGKSEDFKADGLFVAIGHEPNTKLFVGQLDLDPGGLHPDARWHHNQRAGCVCVRRRAGSRLSPGGHRRRHGLHGSHRLGTILGKSRPLGSVLSSPRLRALPARIAAHVRRPLMHRVFSVGREENRGF